MFYFAYGHNTNTKEMLKRVPTASLVGTATLADHKLVFHRFAGVKKESDSQVHGVLWRVSKAGEVVLDECEGLGVDYKKTTKIVRSGDRSLPVYTYEQLLKTEKQPSCQYVAWLKIGYLENGLPLKQLKTALNVARKARRARTTLKRSTPRKYCSLRW
jgi:gamma-glutamylcyclotransferase (GGCT)/AIG2-like uncharacterized protein YtfP